MIPSWAIDETEEEEKASLVITREEELESKLASTEEYKTLLQDLKANGLAGIDTRLIEEIIRDIDRLDSEISETDPRTGHLKYMKPGIRAQILSRRVTATKTASERIQSIRAQQALSNRVQIMGTILRLLNESMKSASISPEARQIVMEDLATRIAKSEEEENKAAKKASK